MKETKLVILIGAIFFCISCGDLLDTAPNNQPSAEAFFTTESAAQDSRVGLYAIRSFYFTDGTYTWDATTDQLYAQHDWGAARSIALGVITPQTGGLVGGFYADAFRIIATANDHIAAVEAMDESLFSTLSKERYLADARFFKAFYYYYLTECYGGVPLYREKLDRIDDFKIAKSSKDEIVTYILEELDLAIEHLPNAPYDGYITRGAAQALKARILLQNRRWQEAADEALNVINSGVYQLHSNYFELFIKQGQGINNEIIFMSEYQFPDVTHSLTRSLIHSTGGTPRQEFADSYLMADGLSTSASTLESSDYQNRDPRFYLTLYDEDDPWLDLANPEPTQTGWIIRKFFDPEILDNNLIHIGGTQDQGIVQIRYAEVLLIYAEAMQMLGSFDQSVYDMTIRLIRDRVEMGNVDISTYTDEAKLDLIAYERNVELAFEGHRRFDLLRWNTLDETILSLSDPTGAVPIWHDHFELWPFTDSELNLNDNLIQNDGY